MRSSITSCKVLGRETVVSVLAKGEKKAKEERRGGEREREIEKGKKEKWKNKKRKTGEKKKKKKKKKPRLGVDSNVCQGAISPQTAADVRETPPSSASTGETWPGARPAVRPPPPAWRRTRESEAQAAGPGKRRKAGERQGTLLRCTCAASRPKLMRRQRHVVRTWSWIREMRGETTIVTPGLTTAGSW